ncbi:hypothetical protein Q765_05870 [Flavobacterium rivuli WB 3.3-2 = DSM 21788]|uniref:Outer membrane protein beta-barrel domain-containing protein n=1 Tax=Flavobacterium rivuli WB 3.3-2 = DSM 21788 TaxID=1121895 RepID=A0A0A2M7T2_9FLAO|nr:hypothetical protein [Flavobacterium rivuli]KGO87656.1 hypothetical protein Q765_05870 [Flavobacterium rivuli WB 3.3-2 = DSM 21788]
MENKKDIGKAFREKLDGLQKQPGNAVWDALKKDLPKKKSRFLPLFWLEASTAIKTVVLTLLTALIVVSGYFLIKDREHENGFKTTGNSIDNGNANLVKKPANTENGASSHKNAEPNNGNKVVGNNLNNKSTSTLNSKGKKLPENTLDGNVKETNTSSAKNKDGKSELPNNNTSSYTTKQSGITVGSTKATAKNNNANNSTAAAGPENSYPSLNKNRRSAKGNSRFSNGKSKNLSLGKRDGALAGTDEAKTNDTANSINTTDDAKDKITISNNNPIPSENALQLTDTISQIADSLCNATIADATAICKDTVEENIFKSDKNGIADFKPFYVFGYGTPATYSLKNALLPDALLAGNTTSTKAQLGYGAYMGYNFTSKWGMRTGIAITGLEHTTQNAFFQNTYSVVPGTGSNPNGYVHILSPENYTNISYSRNGSNAAIIKHLGAQQSGGATVNIIQKIEFAEVPVEVTYNLQGDNFGGGIIGGFSAIFTTKNVVYAQNNMGNLWLGSNKNVKDVGFSTTISLHFYYRPQPYLQINAEPVFKYYVNTFNNGQPYSFGVQAGLQFNFDLFTSKK